MAGIMRIIVDIPKEAEKELEDLKKSFNMKTNAELVRFSLGLMTLIVKHKKEGYDVLLRKGGEVSNIVMPLYVKSA